MADQQHGLIAITVGEARPAMSISWAQPVGPTDSGYIVFFSEFDPDADEDLDPESAIPLCLHCLVEDGDEQLGRGLDLARVHGQVDYDVDDDEWFVPEDAGRESGEA